MSGDKRIGNPLTGPRGLLWTEVIRKRLFLGFSLGELTSSSCSMLCLLGIRYQRAWAAGFLVLTWQFAVQAGLVLLVNLQEAVLRWRRGNRRLPLSPDHVSVPFRRSRASSSDNPRSTATVLLHPSKHSVEMAMLCSSHPRSPDLLCSPYQFIEAQSFSPASPLQNGRFTRGENLSGERTPSRALTLQLWGSKYMDLH